MLANEPFDRFSGKATYAGRSVELSGGQIISGSKHVDLSASYLHAAGDYETVGFIGFQHFVFDGTTGHNVAPFKDPHEF